MKGFFQSISAFMILITLCLGISTTQAKITSSLINTSSVLAPMQINNEIPLTITRSDEFGWGGDTLIAGEDDITFLQFTLINNSNEDIRVMQIVSKNYGNENAQPFSNFTFALFVDNQQQGSAENPDVNGWSYFDLSQSEITIASNSSEEFTLIMDTVEASAPGSIQANIASVTAETVASGDPVTTYEGSSILSYSNQLRGPYYILKEFGTLTVQRGNIIVQDILVEGQENIPVLNITFNAEDDEILVKDIYLENDIDEDGTPDDTGIEDCITFDLYDEENQLIDTQSMVDGTLHFELNVQDRIHVPEEGSTTLSVKANVGDISQANQTGKQLILALDADGSQNNYKGIVAVTSATGNDIDTPEEGWGDAVSENFVAYHSAFTLEHTEDQAPFYGAFWAFQEVYRFTVTANDANEIELGRLTLDVNIDGMEKENGNFETGDFSVYRVIEWPGHLYHTAAMGTEIADITVDQASATPTSARLTIEFYDEHIDGGQFCSFALFMRETADNEQGEMYNDSVTTIFRRDNNYSNPTSRANQNGIVVWSDLSDPEHTDNTSDWLNGYITNIDTNAHINREIDLNN